jgi:hypothetical protein
MAVTVTPGTNAVVLTPGVSVEAIPPEPNGGFITNPLSPSDQGLAVAEVLYVNPIGTAAVVANGSTFALQPGQTWSVISGQASSTFVNAASGGHRFSVVYW